jgi:hypothetical protein
MDGALTVLRFHGAISGLSREVPVQYAGDTRGMVAAPAHPAAKRWWRNFATPIPVEVLLGGIWRAGHGRLLLPGDDGYLLARATYRRRWPRVPLTATNPLVRITVL